VKSVITKTSTVSNKAMLKGDGNEFLRMLKIFSVNFMKQIW
jgi:hypothetical protein